MNLGEECYLISEAPFLLIIHGSIKNMDYLLKLHLFVINRQDNKKTRSENLFRQNKDTFETLLDVLLITSYLVQ